MKQKPKHNIVTHRELDPDKLEMLKQQRGVQAANRARNKLAKEKAQAEAGPAVPSVKIDRSRITLPYISIQYVGEK